MSSVTQPARRPGNSRMSYADRARNQSDDTENSKMGVVLNPSDLVSTDMKDENNQSRQAKKPPKIDSMHSPSLKNGVHNQLKVILDAEQPMRAKVPTIEYVWTPFNKTMLINKIVHEQGVDNEGFVFGHRSTAMRKVRTDTEEMVTTSVTTITILDVVPVKHKGMLKYVSNSVNGCGADYYSMSQFTFYDKAYNTCLVPSLVQAIQEKCDEDEVVVGWYQMVRNGPISLKRMAPKVTNGLRRTALFPEFAPFFLAIRHRDDNLSSIVDTETQLFELDETTGQLIAVPVKMQLAPTVSQLEEQLAQNSNQSVSSVEASFFDDQFSAAAIVDGVERYWERVMASLNEGGSSREDENEEIGGRTKNRIATVASGGSGSRLMEESDIYGRPPGLMYNVGDGRIGGDTLMDYAAEPIASSYPKSTKKWKQNKQANQNKDVNYINVLYVSTVSADTESAPPGLPTPKSTASSGNTSVTSSGPTTRTRRGGRGGGSKK